jgi:hypothetical protein
MYVRLQGQQALGDLGWFVDTTIGTQTASAGHEELTDRAARGLVTNSALTTALQDGARRPDLTDPRDHIKLGEQKRHFLRSSRKQSSLTAWVEAIGHLRALHGQIMASGQGTTSQFELIGEAMHLIQDSFAPAHVEREPRTGDILNIRVYGPNTPQGGHLFRIDPRDDIFTTKPSRALTLSAQKAIACSKEYLQMALRHIQLKQSPFWTPLSLTQQTERDLNAFISRRLWLRLPELRVGSRGEAVGILMGYLNGWLTLNASSLPLLQGSTFDSDMYNAVLAFQKAMGLKADGIVGRETWKKLLLP